MRNRLVEKVPLGYSAAGTVTRVGEAVEGLRPGQRVATGGQGHADVQVVAGRLCIPVADNLGYDEAAFGTVGSIALHALRLAQAGPGDFVVIIGLGLVGQLAARIALASGCNVAGTDPDYSRRALARKSGVEVFPTGPSGYEGIRDWARVAQGADSVLVTAATSSSEPIRDAAEIARTKGSVVCVGDVGLDLDRQQFYDKELRFVVSRSFGPGRYDPTYEELGIDYPIGHVPYPAGRNIATVLDLIASGRLAVSELISYRFPFEQVMEAYEVLETDRSTIAVVLEYGIAAEAARRPDPSERQSATVKRTSTGHLAAGLIGAGRFADSVLIPAAKSAGIHFRGVHSLTGLGAQGLAERHGIQQIFENPGGLINSPDLDIVIVASRHDSHAEYVIESLNAGKHVFCEKPLAIHESDLEPILTAWEDSGTVLMVGFNRRWSPAVERARAFLGEREPLQMSYRIHAGKLSPNHWLHDRRQGGRLLGEACHFIDTLNALAGEAPIRVFAHDSSQSEALLTEAFTIQLAYRSGSQGTILYSSASPHKERKERLEVVSGDRMVRIDDYRVLTTADSRRSHRIRYRPPDKGHRRELAVFRQAVEGLGAPRELGISALESSRASFAAIESLMSGKVVSVRTS